MDFVGHTAAHGQASHRRRRHGERLRTHRVRARQGGGEHRPRLGGRPRPVIVVADTGNDCLRIVFVRAKAEASTVHVLAVAGNAAMDARWKAAANKQSRTTLLPALLPGAAGLSTKRRRRTLMHSQGVSSNNTNKPWRRRRTHSAAADSNNDTRSRAFARSAAPHRAWHAPPFVRFLPRSISRAFTRFRAQFPARFRPIVAVAFSSSIFSRDFQRIQPRKTRAPAAHSYAVDARSRAPLKALPHSPK